MDFHGFGPFLALRDREFDQIALTQAADIDEAGAVSEEVRP